MSVGILVAVLEVGCNTGLVSIGDDRALECEPEDCGERPSDSPVCSDMSMGQYLCTSDIDAGCSWVLSCPTPTCPASECGAPPAGAPMCFDGMWGSAWACDPGEMGCTWQGLCPEQERECPEAECGAPSGFVAECGQGDMLGLNCLRAENDDCRWTSIACASPP